MCIHMEEKTSAFISESHINKYYNTTIRHTASIKGFCMQLTPEEFQTSITLALSALAQMKQSTYHLAYTDALSQEIDKYSKKFKTEIQDLELRIIQLTDKNISDKDYLSAKCSQRIAEIEEETKKVKESLSISEFSNSKLREQFEHLKNTSETLVKSSIDEILRQKDIQHEKELDRLQETIEKSARERVSQCDSQHRNSMEQLKLLYAEKELRLNKELEKTLISSEKGKTGELEFDEIVKQYTHWPILKNMSKTSHGTDRACRIRQCDTLFEIKKYSSDVPSKEVEKFERDMEEHSDHPLGVFISLHTNIVGKKNGQFLQVVWTAKSQLLIYINSFYSHSPGDILNIIDSFADIAWNIYKNAKEQPEENHTFNNLQSRTEQAKIYVEREIKRMTELLTELQRDNKFLKETLDKHHTSYKYNITQSRTALNGIIEILLGKSEEILETPETKPPPKKRVARQKVIKDTPE